jgi:hypothetical protein
MSYNASLHTEASVHKFLTGNKPGVKEELNQSANSISIQAARNKGDQRTFTSTVRNLDDRKQ